MIKRIDTKSGKTISYVYNLKDEDYRIVSERLEMDEDKIKNVIDEETFTPRISKSDWEICKTTREIYSSYIGNNMNITMKVLAAATILITVPNMIFGFYGMNVKLPLQDTGFWALVIIFVIMVALMVVLWKYLKDKVL